MSKGVIVANGSIEELRRIANLPAKKRRMARQDCFGGVGDLLYILVHMFQALFRTRRPCWR